jgi:hypothetical protein
LAGITHLSIAEACIGLRFGFWLTPKVNLLLRANCGGFGFVAANNVDSVLEALVGYQVRRPLKSIATTSSRKRRI